MAHNVEFFRAPIETVFRVLADGWRYADWVVGAQRVRAVDDGFPSVGTKIHHTAGVGPLKLKDNTEVVDLEWPKKLVFHARARPTGVARVTMTLQEAAGGTVVQMHEFPVRGLAAKLDSIALDLTIWARNVRSLRRLRRIVENVAAPA